MHPLLKKNPGSAPDRRGVLSIASALNSFFSLTEGLAVCRAKVLLILSFSH